MSVDGQPLQHGDKGKCTLDSDTLRDLQEGHGGWNPRMSEVSCPCRAEPPSSLTLGPWPVCGTGPRDGMCVNRPLPDLSPWGTSMVCVGSWLSSISTPLLPCPKEMGF